MKHYLVLCVDNDPAVRNLILTDLAPLSDYVELKAVATVDKAKEEIDHCELHGGELALILCDKLDKETLGCNFLIELNQRNSTHRSRKLLLTEQIKLPELIMALNQGGVHYHLGKPWCGQELQDAVKGLLTDYLLEQDNDCCDLLQYGALLDQTRVFDAIHHRLGI